MDDVGDSYHSIKFRIRQLENALQRTDKILADLKKLKKLLNNYEKKTMLHYIFLNNIITQRINEKFRESEELRRVIEMEYTRLTAFETHNDDWDL